MNPADILVPVINGSISVGSDTLAQEKFNTLVLSANGNETGVSVTATEDDTHFILVRPITCPNHVRRPI